MESANYTKISGFSGLLFSLFSEAIKYLGLNILMLKMENYTVEKPDNTLTEWSKLAAPIRMRGQHAPPDATFWEGQNIIYLVKQESNHEGNETQIEGHSIKYLAGILKKCQLWKIKKAEEVSRFKKT